MRALRFGCTGRGLSAPACVLGVKAHAGGRRARRHLTRRLCAFTPVRASPLPPSPAPLACTSRAPLCPAPPAYTRMGACPCRPPTRNARPACRPRPKRRASPSAPLCAPLHALARPCPPLRRERPDGRANALYAGVSGACRPRAAAGMASPCRRRRRLCPPLFCLMCLFIVFPVSFSGLFFVVFLPFIVFPDIL